MTVKHLPQRIVIGDRAGKAALGLGCVEVRCHGCRTRILIPEDLRGDSVTALCLPCAIDEAAS